MPDTSRRSFLDIYDECPYALKQILTHKFDMNGNLWSIVGNILHDIFENDSMSDINSSQDALYEKFLYEFDNLIAASPSLVTEANRLTSYDVVERMKEKAKRDIESYYIYQSTHGKPLFAEVELRLETPEGLPDVTMTLDRVDRCSDGTTVILDYKTGKVFSGRDCVEGFQAPCYLLGFKESYGYLPDRFIFLFTDENKERTLFKINDDQYKLVIRGKEYILTLSDSYAMIVNHLTSMVNGKWGHGKNLNSFKCDNFCEIKKNKLCLGIESGFNKFFRGDK